MHATIPSRAILDVLGCAAIVNTTLDCVDVEGCESTDNILGR